MGEPSGERAERVIRRCATAGRFGSLVQLTFAVAESVEYSPRPTIAAWVGAVMIAEIAAVCLLTVIRHRYLSVRLIRCDIAVGIAALVSEHWITDPRFLAGSWVGWAPGVLMAGLWAASCYLSAAELAVTVAVATSVYLYICWPATAVGGSAGVWLSAFTMAVLPLLFRLVSGYVRRLGDDAATQAGRAHETAARLELDRHRLLMHDSASLLRLMSDADVTPALRAVLRAQADAEAARIQSFLAEAVPPPPVDAPGTNLQSVVEAVGLAFADLPLDIDAERVSGVELPAPAGAAVASALSAVLHNVRLHAAARSVTVQALATDRGWCMVVADDGRGFVIGDDPGFGLRHQVTGALANHQIEVSIRSSPGEGTTVLFVAPTPSASGDQLDRGGPATSDGPVPVARRGRGVKPDRPDEVTIIQAGYPVRHRRRRPVLEPN